MSPDPSSLASGQLDIIGLTCVAITLLAYALEERGPVWVLIFAGGSFSSGIYALLQGAWPFAIAEAVWTVIALQRWRRRRVLRF
jgi:hypothetical protein